MTTCEVQASDISFLRLFMEDPKDATVVLRSKEIEALSRLCQKCHPDEDHETLSRLITILNGIFESKSSRDFQRWDRFLRTCPGKAELGAAMKLYQSSGRFPRSSPSDSPPAQYLHCSVYQQWWILSTLTPFVPYKQQVTGNAIWKTGLLVFDVYKKHKFKVDLSLALLSIVFPSVQAHWLFEKVVYTHRILDTCLRKDIKGLTKFFQNMKTYTTTSSLPIASPKFNDPHTKVIISDINDPVFRQLFKHDIHYSSSSAAVEKTPPTAPQKKQYYGKHSGIVTKNLNASIRSMNETFEKLILSNPFFDEHKQYVPLALSLLYMMKKSIVIDKYETFVRSFNNAMRRALGEKIKPTALNPLQLLLSGKIRPIIRRDLLFTNLCLILATFQKDIYEYIVHYK